MVRTCALLVVQDSCIRKYMSLAKSLCTSYSVDCNIGEGNYTVLVKEVTDTFISDIQISISAML